MGNLYLPLVFVEFVKFCLIISRMDFDKSSILVTRLCRLLTWAASKDVEPNSSMCAFKEFMTSRRSAICFELAKDGKCECLSYLVRKLQQLSGSVRYAINGICDRVECSSDCKSTSSDGKRVRHAFRNYAHGLSDT